MKIHELWIQGNNLRETDNNKKKKPKSWTKFDKELVFLFFFFLILCKKGSYSSP